MTFYEAEHRYVHNDIVYTSVTTSIKNCHRPKNWEEIAENYALKNGETKEYWLNVWKDNREMAAAYGTMFHLYKEHGTTEVSTTNEKHALSLDNLEGEYKELILWDDYYLVAGQTDKAIFKNKVEIRDYKTNKELKTEPKSFYVKGIGKTTERYLPPLSHLEVYHLNDYALQLSVYGYILERRGYEVGDLVIEHIVPTLSDYTELMQAIEGGYIEYETKEYEVPYLRNEAKNLMRHTLNKRKW